MFSPETLASSPELKAVETARIIGGQLGLEVSVRRGLREHERSADWLPEAEFRAGARALLARRDEAAFGDESADEVAGRVESEIRQALACASGGNALLVTHGRAIACFLRRIGALDAFGAWESLDMPAFVAIEVPRFAIIGCGGMDCELLEVGK